MIIFRGHRFFSILLVTLFLFGQVLASAHAGKYGGGPHTHDGKLCVLALASDDNSENFVVLPASIDWLLSTSKDVFLCSVAPALKIVSAPLANARSPPYL